MYDAEKEMLFEKFGLCPDYTVVYTDSDTIEYSKSPQEKYKKFTTYDYHKPEFEPGLDRMVYPEKASLHLDTHTVEMENGMKIHARFAVSHSERVIFLKVSPLGEFGRIEEYE